jgi:WD40 repeat protein
VKGAPGSCEACDAAATNDAGTFADGAGDGEALCDACSSNADEASLPPIDLDAFGCPICPTDGQPHCGPVMVDSDGPGCMQAITTYDGATTLSISVGWSPIDDFALVGSVGAITLLQVDRAGAALSQATTYTGLPNRIFLRWSPDGQFALGASTEVQLLAIQRNPPTVTERGGFAIPGGDLYGVLWSPDSTHALIFGEDGIVRMLAVNTRNGRITERAEFTGHVGKVYGMALAPDGNHAMTVGQDNTARLLAVDFQAETMTELQSIARPEWQTGISWSHQDNIAEGSWGSCNATELWPFDPTTNMVLPGDTFFGHTSGVRTVEWSPNGYYLLAGGHNDTLNLFSLSGNKLINVAWLPDAGTGVHDVSFAADGTYALMAASTRDRATLVDLRSCLPP